MTRRRTRVRSARSRAWARRSCGRCRRRLLLHLDADGSAIVSSSSLPPDSGLSNPRKLAALKLPAASGSNWPIAEARCRSRSQHLAAPRGRTTDTTPPPPIQRPALAFKPDIGQTSVALSSAATGNTWCCPIFGAPRNSGSSHSIR